MAFSTGFLRSDAASLHEVAKLTPDDAAAEAWFGFSVGMSGNTALIGARRDDGGASRSGSAYIFQKEESGGWIQGAKLIASDTKIDDFFGVSVAISGQRALVGAYGDDGNGTYSGSAYVFHGDDTGNWNELTKLVPNDGADKDFFGLFTDIFGSTAIVGAPGNDDDGAASGSAYIFREDEVGDWNQVAKLTASDAAAFDQFGWSVDLFGNRALVGAHGDDGSGSAYVFEEDGNGNWHEVTKLVSNDPYSSGGSFARRVALSGDYAIVGDSNNSEFGTRSGSAYIFHDDGLGRWNQIAKLTASDAEEFDRFGTEVAISGQTVVIGALEANGSGSAYVFEQDSDGGWYEVLKLNPSETSADDVFAETIALSGNAILIGSSRDDDGGVDSGSAYIFVVPEPATALLLVVACAFVAFVRRK